MTDPGCLLALEGTSVDVPRLRTGGSAASPPANVVDDLDATSRGLFDQIMQPAFGIEPQQGVRRKVLTILWDPHKDDVPDRADVATMREVLHGTTESVRDYFLEVSYGQFTIEDAGVLGWYDADHDPDAYWPGGGEVGQDSGAEAIRKAARDIDFSQFDTDGDGDLHPDEVAVLFILPGTGNGGGLIRTVGDDFVPRGEADGIEVDGVRITRIAEVSIGSPPTPGIVAHELSHLLLGLGDMYFKFFTPSAAGPYSLMDQDGNAPHLDPAHKLKLGWLWPRVRTSPGTYELPSIGKRREALALVSPERGPDEYFLVENRYPAGRYDAHLPHHGLGVWHVIEDPDTFRNHPPPRVASRDWDTVGGWSRQGIRMVRPVLTPPISATEPVWDGSRNRTDHDLVSRQQHAEHGTLRWADGSPSGFAITDVPAAADTVEVDLDTEWSPGGGIEAATGTVRSMAVAHDDRFHHLDAEVSVALDGRPDDTFGFSLRPGGQLAAGQQMLARLRACAASGRRVRLEFRRDGAALRRIIRVSTP